MSSKVTLGYWNIRGLAERVRHLLEYLHIDYDQVMYTPETTAEWFEKTKPELLKKNAAANLPYLLDGDKVICQSDAILVYLCHKANKLDLLGQSADDQVQIATVKGVFTDLSKAFYGHVYGPRKYEQFKEEAIKTLNTHFTKIDGLLGNNQFLCSKLTYVDFIIADFVQAYSLFNENFAAEFPRLKALQQKVWGIEQISAYLKSDKYKERPINWYPSAKWF